MAQNPNYDANVVKQILAVTNNGNKQMLTQMFNDPAKRYLQPAIILAGMQSDADQRQIALQQGAQPTVAAKTLGVAPPPPTPPAGLGSLPPGAPAPQGAPPMQMASAPAPQGMPQMAGGGLTTLPIPDSMLDEQTFAGGGVVAFAKAGSVDAKAERIKALLAIVKRGGPEGRAARVQLNGMYGQGSVDSAPDYSAPAWYGLGAKGDRGSIPIPNSPQSSDGSIYSPTEGDSASAGNFRESVRHMHDPFPSFSDRVSQDPNASHFRAPQNADDSIYSPSGGDVPTPTPSAPPEKQFKDFHGPLHPAYEWVKENFGLAPEDRALRDNTLNKGTGLSPEGAWWYKPQVGEDTSKMALLRDGNPSLVAPSFAGSTLGTPKSSAGLEALMAAQKTPATTRTPTTPAALTAALTATPRPRVPGTLTTKPKADADTTAPAAKTASIEDLQKKFDETGKLPDFKKLSAEERAAQKNEDLWTSLAQIGFGMAAGKSQNALSNIGEGAAAAMPGMQAALKERRADEKDERKQEFDYLVKAAGAKGDNLKSAYSVFNNMADREQRETLEGMRIKAQASEGRFNRENQLAAAGISANALPPDVRTLKYLEAHPGAEALYNRVEAAKNPLGMLRAQSDITAAELGIDKTNQRALDAARRNAVAQPNNLAYAQAYTKLQLEIEQKKAAARARIMGATPNFGPTGGGGANVIHSAADYFKGS